MNLVFQFVLITLVCFRLQRVMTSDTWPLTEWFRNRLREKYEMHETRASSYFGVEGALPNEIAEGNKQLRYARIWREIHEMFTCPHCFGFHVCWIAYLALAQYLNIPLPVLQAFASAGVISMWAELIDR